MDGISIIICCYNSSSRIRNTLEWILNQKCRFNYEVIIINNNSTDDTLNVCESFKNTFSRKKISYRIVNESNSGLMNARIRGINEAKYGYAIFCDDDNWLNNSYCQNAVELMNSNHEIGVLGGRSEAVTEIKTPFWFSTYQSSYAIGVQAISSGDISQRGYIWGAGMVFRRDVIKNALEKGYTFILSDRDGDKITSGGDSEICKLYLIAGFKLWYSDSLVFQHFIPASRLNTEYLEKLLKSFNVSQQVLYKYDYFIFLNKEKTRLVKYSKVLFHFIKVLVQRDSSSRLYLSVTLPKYISSYFDIEMDKIRKIKDYV